MQLYNGYTNYVPANTSSKLLHSGAGKVHAILLTGQNATADSLTLYDSLTAVGNVLVKLNVSLYAPVVVHLDRLLPLVFSTGLTAVTTTGACAFVLTEA
jgi:hypothetical protein